MKIKRGLIQKKQSGYFTEKAIISYIQISILIIALFAFSYTINEIFKIDDNWIDDNEIEEINGIEEINYKSYNKILGRIKLNELFNFNNGIKLVDAATFGEGCCELTKSGNICQTISLDQCDTKYKTAPTDCELTDFCELGCCISPKTGLCNKKTSKIDCEKKGGIFKKDSACNVQECRQACCIIGEESIWTTEANCKFEGNTENKNLPTNWRTDINSELQCLFQAEKNKEGACVFESGEKRKCVLTSLDDCFKRTGSETNFAKDKFCSDQILNTTCTAKDHKGCVVGKEDVYWFDSCNNKESVASDCDFYKGNYCGKEKGEFICKDIKCDTNNDGIKDRENGESWCSYDAAIGNGKDPPGSRHIRHICHMGIERLDPCSDFRQEICVQEDTTTKEGRKFSQAACRVNQWRTCLDLNKKKGNLESECKKNPDCRVKSINMGGSFAFTVCLPNYPPGFELTADNLYDENGNLDIENYNKASSADGICDIATHKCTQLWRCCLFGCVCIDNCECSTNKFTTEMNDFCKSLGDCGAFINYIGDHSNSGYTVSGAPFLSSSAMGYSQYANKAVIPAPPGDFAFFNTINPEQLPEVKTNRTNLSAFEQELLGVAGSFGSPLLLEILKQGSDNETDIGLENLRQNPVGFARFTSGLSSAKAAILAQIVEKDEQVKDFSMLSAMIAGLIAYMITQSILITALAALLAFLIFGLCWIKKVQIYFTCLPWEPPPGGDKCNECNKLDVPCTEYRCESLGQLCHLINKGTGKELCISKPVNETLPVITPFETVITKGYKYYNVNTNGFDVVNASDNGCLQPYEPVDIGLKVNPFAKCRIGNDPKQSYEEMSEIFGPKGNYILPAHLIKLFFVSPEAFKNVYNLTEESIKNLGKIDYYIKCRTASGKQNSESYHIKTCIKPGPDLTPPRITVTFPLSGSYLKYNTEKQDVLVYVNEPSECKWSIEDKEFKDMENKMSCEINPLNYALYGLPCNATLTNLQNNTKFYFRCMDLSENSNTMVESYLFEFKKSISELFIDEIIPKQGEIIVSNVEPISSKLRLSTSGGAERGRAVCEWTGNGYSDSFRYQNVNGSNIHEYQLTSLSQGKYNLNFICKDLAGNIAENSTSFDVIIDKFGPKITRIYFENGLKVVTAEKAECRYSFSTNFIFENGTRMGSDGFNHFAGWVSNTYFIQCKDNFGNKGSRVKVKPFNV